MTSSIALISLTLAVVAAHPGFMRPMMSPGLLPMSMFGPMRPPMMGPIIRPFIRGAFPVFQRRSYRSRRIARPASRPFVIETPDFNRREEQPVIIKIVDSHDAVRDIGYQQRSNNLVIENPRYFDDTGDISIDGNVYITDPYAASNIKQGASVEQVISAAVNSGQYRTDDNSMIDYDYPLPAAAVGAALRSPVPSILESRRVGATINI